MIALHQPWRGVVGTLVAVGGSLLLAASISPAAMASWVTLGVTSLIPLQFLIAAHWHHQQPAAIARLAQPWRGLAFLALFVAFGAIVAATVNAMLGGGTLPPGPFSGSFVIYAVQITLWLVIGFGAWPASRIASPLLRTIATLAMVYAITFALYVALFNFSHLTAAPFYDAALDPHGAFVAWLPISFTISTVAVLLTLVYVDFLPIAALARRWPALAAQPAFGLATLAFCGAIGGALWWIGIGVLRIDPLVFLARVDVPYVFGTLMVINLFEMAPFVALRQPWRGAVLTVATILLALVIGPTMTLVADAAFGGLAAGAPTYDYELWAASTLLALTFPVMALYSGAFAFWPFGSEPR